MPDELAPTAFIVMPYGRKRDPVSGITIDFDNVWDSAFRPAALQAGVEPVRADEERLGGFVHLALFERLLLAEIVLADLTIASPNVMYELGIRHATRPRATISTYAKIAELPFDVSPIRAVPYRLNSAGALTQLSRDALIEALAERFQQCREDTAADSPLFQLIRNYPGVSLSHEVTETFQQRAQSLLHLSNEIRGSSAIYPRNEALQRLRRLATQVTAMGHEAPSDVLVDLFLAYRDVEAYDEMVELEGKLPSPLQKHPTIRQQLALALNRRNARGDVRRAIRLLEDLLDEQGPTPETLGILGRIHKDEYCRHRDSDPARAHVALQESIKAYESGFRADMRDYYPGVNAVTLLIVDGSEEARHRAGELSPVVAFAVAGRQGLSSRDYWDVATVLELSVARRDPVEASKASARLLYLEPPDWVLKTVAKNLQLLRESLERDEATPWLVDLLRRLRPGDSAQ